MWPPALPENDSTDAGTIKQISDLMVSAMDSEIGRLLVGIGLATQGPGGELIYNPSATNTMIVIAGDNGTYLNSVSHPYNPLRAKGTPYETAMRAPLIVAGPMVASPGRTVDHLVNCVDLFQLFGELAGLDVRATVPQSHILDSRPMLAYLTNVNQAAFRQTIFSQIGNGLKAPSTHIWPTVIPVGPANIATDILFTSQGLAETEGGTWYGPGGAQVFYTACDLRAANIYTNLTIVPTRAWTLRNERYKLIKLDRAPCDASLGQFEFYDLSETPLNPINPLGLDNSENDLLSNGVPVNLSVDQELNYDGLQAEMTSLLASEPGCNADGNLDKQVTQADADGVLQYWGQPSWFDVNRDGKTDQLDLDCVMANLGNDCLVRGPGTNCPTPVSLNNPTVLLSGGFKFTFASTAGALFQVLASTNLSLTSSNWTLLGAPTETSAGQFQFIDSQPANRPWLFYRVRTQ